jgi:hypothetical protein
LIAATRDPAPFAIALLIAAAVVEYGAIRDHALAWRWIIALAADFCAFLLVYLTTRPHGLPEGYAPVPILVVTVVQAALLAVYLGSTAVRTLLRRQRIAWFEIGQAAAAVLFVILANRRPGVSAGMIVAAAGCYAAAFMPKARRISRNFHAYATFGLVLLLGGSFILFPGLIAAAWWCILALVATFLGEHRDIDTLSVHGMIYLLAATAGAGWSGDYWLPMLTAALAYYAMLWIGRKRHRIAATVAPAVLAGTTYGFAAAMLSGAQVDRNLASTLETLLISLMALVLGWMAKQWNLTELIWILYPWMAFGAVKLFAQDFGQTRPVTLSLSLLVYGGTLMALPRLLRKTGGARSDLS